MRTSKLILGIAVACALVMGLFAPAPAVAQYNPYKILMVPDQVASYSVNITAVDTAPVMVIKYIGSTTQASTVAVTTFDYIFTVGGAADTTISGCGGTAGTLDTNNAACNTLGELVNKINASTNWLAIPLGGLYADSVDTGGASSAADVTATTGNIETGVATYHDTSDELSNTVTFMPGSVVDFRSWVQGQLTNLKPANPFRGRVSTLQYYIQNFTGSAGAGNIYAVTDTWGGATGKTWSQTNRVLYAFTGAATGVDKALDFSNAPVFTNPNERIVIRGAAGTTLTSPRVNFFGFTNIR